MAIEYTFDFRTTDDLASPQYKGLKDPYGILSLSEQKRRAFRNNPYLSYWNEYSQQVAHSDGVAFACQSQFPLRLKTPVDVRTILGGSTTFVAKEYRKTEAALDFSSNRKSKAPGMGSTGSAMSQMMIKFYKLTKINVFEFPRYILLFKSRAVVEMKLHGLLAKVIVGCCDIAAFLFFSFVSTIVRFRTRKFEFESVSVSDDKTLDSVSELVARDSHPFAEVHDKAWFRWMMTEAFSGDPMSMVVIKYRGDVVGFYMTKLRFHEQASARGFKNVWLRSIMEWQALPEYSKLLPWFLMRAAVDNRKGIDACELIINDSAVARLFRLFGAQHVGNGNYRCNVDRRDPLQKSEMFSDQQYWRIRPALGDAGLN